MQTLMHVLSTCLMVYLAAGWFTAELYHYRACVNHTAPLTMEDRCVWAVCLFVVFWLCPYFLWEAWKEHSDKDKAGSS